MMSIKAKKRSFLQPNKKIRSRRRSRLRIARYRFVVSKTQERKLLNYNNGYLNRILQPLKSHFNRPTKMKYFWDRKLPHRLNGTKVQQSFNATLNRSSTWVNNSTTRFLTFFTFSHKLAIKGKTANPIESLSNILNPLFWSNTLSLTLGSISAPTLDRVEPLLSASLDNWWVSPTKGSIPYNCTLYVYPTSTYVFNPTFTTQNYSNFVRDDATRLPTLFRSPTASLGIPFYKLRSWLNRLNQLKNFNTSTKALKRVKYVFATTRLRTTEPLNRLKYAKGFTCTLQNYLRVHKLLYSSGQLFKDKSMTNIKLLAHPTLNVRLNKRVKKLRLRRVMGKLRFKFRKLRRKLRRFIRRARRVTRRYRRLGRLFKRFNKAFRSLRFKLRLTLNRRFRTKRFTAKLTRVKTLSVRGFKAETFSKITENMLTSYVKLGAVKFQSPRSLTLINSTPLDHGGTRKIHLTNRYVLSKHSIFYLSSEIYNSLRGGLNSQVFKLPFLYSKLNATNCNFTYSVRGITKFIQNFVETYFEFNRNSTNLLQLTNLWIVKSSTYKLRKRLLKFLSNASFQARVMPLYNATLIRFLENITGRRVSLMFGPFVEETLTVQEWARCKVWGDRVRGFQKRLGHRIFVNESIFIITSALKLKDPTLLANWIRAMLGRMSFWKYKMLFRYLKFLIQYVIYQNFSDLQIKGFKLRLKGKISVAGNARTRTLFYRIGKTGHATINNRVSYDLSFVNTFTGVMGLKVWIFF